MFRPLAMRHVTLQLLRDDLTRASLALADLEVFAPDHRPLEQQRFPNIPGARFRTYYQQARGRLDKLAAHFAGLPAFTVKQLHEVAEDELQALNERLGEIWAQASEIEERLRRLDEDTRLVAQLEHALKSFANLRVNLGLLQGDKQFLDLRVGTLPRDNLARTREALELASFFVYEFLLEADTAHVVVVGQKDGGAHQVDAVLDAAGFRKLAIPQEFHAAPEKVRRELAQRRSEFAQQRAQLEQEIKNSADEHRAFLQQAQIDLALAEPFANLEDAARHSGELAIITGWVPRHELSRVEDALRARLQHAFLLTARKPTGKEREEVPTVLPPRRLLAPFTTLVTQYGVPRYGEIDPSAVFATTFVLMFGMMFGDVGHGLVILLAGLVFRRKLQHFVYFVVAAGITSTLFGFVYGSVFSYKYLFEPLWMSPLADPVLMLMLAIIWGIGFLLLVSLLSVYNRFVVGDWASALFDTNGVANIVLYLGFAWGGYSLYSSGGFGSGAAVLIALALLSVMGYKWVETRAPFGERALMVLIETFETLMGSVSNSLSFLRVAAFSLNHVALAIAVFTLADMMDGVGHWLMLVFGNIFIIVLEGAIVTIQVLRLEYYEGFSRFFSGDGRAFRPLTLCRGVGHSVPVQSSS